jgi:chromosome partitioning protein
MRVHFLSADGMPACKIASKDHPATTKIPSEITCKRCASIANGGVNGGRKKLGLVYSTLRIGFYPEDCNWLEKHPLPKSEVIRELVHHGRRTETEMEKAREKKMVVIAIVSNSGGSGKTTTARNLGYEMACKGQKVLLVDLDPQTNLDLFCGLLDTPSHPDGDITSVFNEDFDGPWPCSKIDGETTEIVRGSAEIAKVQIGLSNRRNRERCLTKAIKSLPSDYDIVLLDCPATTGLIIENALAAATHVLIPVAPKEKSIQGLGALLSGLAKLGKDLEIDPPKLLGIVPSINANSKSLTTRRCLQDLKDISEALGFDVLPGIGDYEDILRATAVGLPIRRYRPGHPAVSEYRKLAEHTQALLGNINGNT